MRIEITVTERIEVPDDACIEYGDTGVARGVRLADGRIVNPWVALELEEADDGEAHDMTSDEIDALGILRDIDFDRTIHEL